jgi:leucyl-tRNA synthetase
MQFVNALKSRLTVGGEDPQTVFNRALIYDEIDTVKHLLPILKKCPTATKTDEVNIVVIDEQDRSKGKDSISGETVDVPSNKSIQDAVPGNPGIVLVNL